MKFNVTWRATAEAELAHIWLGAANRNAVTKAAFEVDSCLERDPIQTGESRVDNLRVVIVAPLVVYFIVYEDEARVDVTHVRACAPRT